MAAGKIFLCYRREDSAGHAGRIYDRLNQRFPGRVFMDVTGIGVGTRWAEVIEQTLGSCEVAVILIGRRWLERDPAGGRRIDDPEDPLRAEITTALRLGLKIVPLLVAAAAVPEHHDLPAEVAPIVSWQALRIDDDDFDHDASRLVAALERHLKDEGRDPHIENDEAKRAEIGRLLANAEGWIGRSDWVRAAQTLQAVLSLDKGNATAAARLRFVQEQSRIPRPAPPPPAPKGHAGRWAAFGILGALGAIGAAVAAVIVVAVVLANRGGGDGRTNPSLPSPDPPAPVVEPAAPQLAGDYELASYAQQGMADPRNGTLRLAPVGPGRFQFALSISNPRLNRIFYYYGYLVSQGVTWTMTTAQTNDPWFRVGRPIPTQVRFDGSTLMMGNTDGQTFVWQRR